MKKKIATGVIIAVLMGTFLLGFTGCNSSQNRAVTVKNPDDCNVRVVRKNSGEVKNGQEVPWGTVLEVEIQPKDGEQYKVTCNGFRKRVVDNKCTVTVRGKTTIEVERKKSHEEKREERNRHEAKWTERKAEKRVAPVVKEARERHEAYGKMGRRHRGWGHRNNNYYYAV
ncbi:MAG: hypothetical protein FWC82_01095 [Firmicutes bacterium]|nr:hypothetical protein [Bacillota bacterium]